MATQPSQKQRSPTLRICFTTEMWERFAFMMVMGLLVFILLKQYHLPDSRAAETTGAFTGVVYITSLLGGYIADHYIGYYRAVIVGAFFLLVGYMLLALTSSFFFLCCSLGTVCVGTGLLKSNVSSYLGLTFDNNHAQRQRAFSIFYAGINIGAMLGNITSGYCYEGLGSAACFTIAATGIAIGLLVFYFGFRYFNITIIKSQVSGRNWLYALLMSLFGIILSAYVIYLPDLATAFFTIVVIGSVYLIYRYSAFSTKQMKKSTAFFLFLIIGIIFNAIFNQMFLSMNVFNDRLVNHILFGHDIPTQLFLITNNIAVIALSLTISRALNYLRDANKFILGMFLCSFVFFIINIGLHITAESALLPAYWVITAYVVLSTAEVCISPIGLSLASRLAPEGRNGFFMGLWLLTYGIGGYLGGVIAKIAAIPKDIKYSITQMKAIYTHAFDVFTWISIGALLLTFAAAVAIKKLIPPTRSP